MLAIAALLRVWFAVALAFTPLAVRQPEFAQPETSGHISAGPSAPLHEQAIRISQVYGGDISGAPYPCDFVELFNSTDQSVSMNGWSLQYRTATGSSWGGKPLRNLSIAPHGYFLVAGHCTVSPPSPMYDFVWTINMDPFRGKVALASKETAISGLSDPAVLDFVGYGAVDEFEGSAPAGELNQTMAGFRGDGGCADTDDNSADFTAALAAPRTSASPPHTCSDAAPTVASTSPASGATDIARDANLAITFSEPVTLGAGWFDVTCDLSPTVSPESATVSGGPTSYTIDPNVDFYADDFCTMTIHASAVTDNDTSDPPDTMGADYAISFRTVPGQCGEPAYPIHAIQGAGASSPAIGQQRTVEGVVTGDFQGADGLSGYFVQEETAEADADPQSSEGIFVDEQASSMGDVAAGSVVRVTGTVSELEGMTALTEATRTLACGSDATPAAVNLALPLASIDEWEQYEGMLVQFGERLTVAESTELGSKGRLTLVKGEVPRFYSQQNPPDVAGYAAWESALALRTIFLEDGSDQVHPDPIRFPPPGLTVTNTLRIGDVIDVGLTGIVDSRGVRPMIQPTAQVTFLKQNDRSAAPVRTGGNVRVAFLSLDDYFNVTAGSGGERGASSPAEFARQRDKLIQALVELDADVIGVSKLENDGFGPEGALADLVQGLNTETGPGTYAFVTPAQTTWGSDSVKVGIVYRDSAVNPIGMPAVLDTGAFSQEPSPPIHRAPMAQTFEVETWGERFTVVVNEWHDRSGCPSTGSDADAGDGQGCWNAARTAAADELAAWLASDPTNSDDPDVLVLGELNAFAQEDPVQHLIAGGYIDLIARDAGPGAVTNVAGARSGYSDHALASAPLHVQVVRTAVWAINAEEPAALDYQMENKSASQLEELYAPDAYRSSDQNPVVVDLSLEPDRSDLGGAYGLAWHTGQGVWRLGPEWGGEDDGISSGEGSWNDGQGELLVTVNGPAGQYACLYGWLDFSDGTTAAGVADTPDGDWDTNENVLAGSPLSPGASQLVTFTLPIGVIGGDPLNMRLRLVPAPDPVVANCDGGQLAPAAAPEPTGRADGGEVEDYVFEASPLAVDLVSFSSRADGRHILLTWETVSEEEVAGFDLQRARAPEGPWQPVNLALIPAKAPGSGVGATYRYTDDPGRAGVWLHRLTAVHVTGQREVLGTAQSELAVPNALQLSEFRRADEPGWPIWVLLGGGGLLGLVRLLRQRAAAKKSAAD